MLAATLIFLICPPADARDEASIFFLHNSVGLGLIEQGAMRAYLDDHNAQRQTGLALWDHNYPYIGVSDPDGELLGYPYSSNCGHNTNPDGLHGQWLDDLAQYAAARDSILSHDVIAFKSCYRACDFEGAATEQELAAALARYKDYYLDMRAVFDQHPDKVFVVLSPPPRHRLHAEQSVARAATARQFAQWLQSPEFLGDPPRPNLRVFDLFALLAAPDDGSPAANMLRSEYERSSTAADSHPNAQANAVVGPLLMRHLIDAAGSTVTAVGRLPEALGPTLQAHPNPFNPATTLRFELPRTDSVTLEILDLQGRRVKVLAAGTLAGGWHEFVWRGHDQRGRSVGSGVFLCRLQTAAGETVQRLTLVR